MRRLQRGRKSSDLTLTERRCLFILRIKNNASKNEGLFSSSVVLTGSRSNKAMALKDGQMELLLNYSITDGQRSQVSLYRSDCNKDRQ